MRFTTRSAIIALVLGAAVVGTTDAKAQAQLYDNSQSIQLYDNGNTGSNEYGVQLFNAPPSVDQLRSILIPEVPSGSHSRKIVIPGQKDVRVSPTANARLTQEEPPPAAPAPPPQYSRDPAPMGNGGPAPAMVPAKPAKPTLASTNAQATSVGFHINFGFDSAAIPAQGTSYLDSIAELLLAEPTLVLVVEGHTDAVGSPAYNLDLSRRRADSVMAYLRGKGVNAEQMITVGKGMAEPLVDDGFDPRNRRVQFNRVKFGNASS